MPLVRGHYPVTHPGWLTNGQPSGVLRENLPGGRYSIGGNLTALTTEVMTSVAVPLEAGDVISNITFVSATTAANTPVAWWFALYDDSATPALIAQTADQEDAAWAANTAKTLALSSSYLVPRAGVYYAAIMVKATTPPTLAGTALHNAANAGALVTGQKILAQTSGSSLAAEAPATIATATTVSTVPYVALT